MRRLLALLLLAAAAPASEPKKEFVQAVEFPYYLYPRALWERELVWLKALGVHTVAFSIPWNWHQIQPGEYDLTGSTSPRRDLTGLIRLLRRLELRAWIRPLPPVRGWLNSGWPAGPPDARAERAWLRELSRVLTTQTASHGGPVAFMEGRGLTIDATAPPASYLTVSATNPAALARSREALTGGHGALLWEDVEDSVSPPGWTASPGPLIRPGAVGLSGDERTSTAALRRSAALLRNWAPLVPALRTSTRPVSASNKLPQAVSAVRMTSPAASVVSIANAGPKTFHDDLRVREPGGGTLVIPGVTVPAGESLWLPAGVSIGADGLCRSCTNFSSAEHIVYASAELLGVEYENGILAMEFAAPAAGEVLLQLARKPVGPFLAAGHPMEFDWDEKTLRARLPIPAGQTAGNRVRIGLAIEAPDTSAFFTEARRLLIGQKNLISTVYSSGDVAARSRLRLPEGYTARPIVKTPNEIDYEVAVPAEALHGDWADFALEADGLPLGRAHLQTLRPASVRWSEAIRLHFGSQAELPVEPPTAPMDARSGRNMEIVIRNNSAQIQNYTVEAAGEGLRFYPSKIEVSVGALMERPIELRVFNETEAAGMREWKLRVSGGADLEMPMRIVLVPRGGTVAWSADLDGDGSPEWVLESQKARAVFSAPDGGRWLEFIWKDSGVNFLPDTGAFAASGPTEVRANGDSLEFSGRNWNRTARLVDGTLTIEQTSALPPDPPQPEKRDNTSLTITRESPSKAIYTLN